MQVDDFPTSYKLQMIRAYPIIAQMDADEEYFATPAERDEAFGRVLANRNLRPTHEMFLADAATADPEPIVNDQINPEWWKLHHQDFAPAVSGTDRAEP